MEIKKEYIDAEKGYSENVKQIREKAYVDVENASKELVSVCDQLNEQFKDLIGKKCRLVRKSWYGDKKEYSVECYFYGFEAVREGVYSNFPYRKIMPKIFKSKKDGSESKVKESFYGNISEILRIELADWHG